jgi:hypothetical protein
MSRHDVLLVTPSKTDNYTSDKAAYSTGISFPCGKPAAGSNQ